MQSSLITLNDIKLARSRISGVASHTPIVQLLEHPHSPPLYLKAECLQPIGAFKIRGAYNKIASLSVEENAVHTSELQKERATQSQNTHALATTVLIAGEGIQREAPCRLESSGNGSI